VNGYGGGSGGFRGGRGGGGGGFYRDRDQGRDAPPAAAGRDTALAVADDAASGNAGQPVVLPRSSKRPRFHTQSLGDSDEEDMSGGKWEGTGGLLQFLNSGDELKCEKPRICPTNQYVDCNSAGDNPKWSVWTAQTAGTQYAEPAQAAGTDPAAIDSKDVSKKFAPRLFMNLKHVCVLET
jgi:hypothetical protein